MPFSLDAPPTPVTDSCTQGGTMNGNCCGFAIRCPANRTRITTVALLFAAAAYALSTAVYAALH